MEKLNALDWISLVLLIIGGLNWGILGVFEFNVVAAIFGSLTIATRVIYILVGLSALYLIAVIPSLGREKKT